MVVERFVCGRVRSNAYVLGEDGGPAVLVDAGAGAVRQVTAHVERHGLVPQALLLTHGHPDHILTARELADRYAIPAYIHRDDLSWFTDPATGQHLPFFRAGGRAFGRMRRIRPKRLHVVEDGVRLAAGPFTVGIVHTPGHSKGSACLIVDDAVMFSGDTVFRGNIGRVYVGGDRSALRSSVRSKLLPLPDDLRVLPGHGPQTVVGDERALWQRFAEGGSSDLRG